MKWKFSLDLLIKSESKEIIIHQLEKAVEKLKKGENSFSSYDSAVNPEKLIFETEYDLIEVK